MARFAFSVMGLYHVSNAAEQHTPMKAHAVTTIDQAATDKQLVRQQRKRLIIMVKKRQPTYQHQHRNS